MAVSIEQAAADAAIVYLKTQFPGLAMNSRWPSKDFPNKAITLITAGPRREQMLDARVLSNTAQGSNQTRAVWQIAECSQPVQLDVWTATAFERTDMIARLDVALRAGFAPLPWITNCDPVANGFFVAVASGWEETNTTAHFVFDSPDHDDTSDAAGRAQFRATYRGDCYVKLAIPAVSPRQKTITLKAYLDGANKPSTDTLIH